MDVFPFNLVLIVAVASATIFLGFLPTRSISSSFFARETGRAAVAWIVVAVIAPPAIFHYYLFLSFLCFGARWKFHGDHAFGGKMWLNIASGLGISIGVVFLLAVTPRAYPAGWTQTAHALLLASIYLGGAVIGLAYVSQMLIHRSATESGITNRLIQRHVRLLLVLVLMRPLVLLAATFSPFPFISTITIQMHSLSRGKSPSFPYPLPLMEHLTEWKFALGLLGIVLPCLVFAAWGALRSGKKAQASYALASACLIGLIAEILARLLVL